MKLNDIIVESKLSSAIAIFLLSIMCCFSSKGQLRQVSISSGWTFRKAGDSLWLPATVPGSVHVDLLANHRIPDPYYRDNEKQLHWIGEKDWEYKTDLNFSSQQLNIYHLNLIFTGLDTYADIFIDNIKVLATNNMHRSWTIDVKRLLHPGSNTLLVHFNNVFKMDVPKYLQAYYKLQAWPITTRVICG
jgi:beta-mannosidase